MSDDKTPVRRLRSQDWFDNPDHLDMTALYLERFMNYGVTPEELRSGKPVIGIAQSGSDLTPCNRVHVELVKRVQNMLRLKDVTDENERLRRYIQGMEDGDSPPKN